jgi:invasion protein IalB
MVMVPLGKLIKPGMHVMIYPMGLWENVKTNEGVSESDQPGLQSLSLSYTLCHPAGCTAEVEATPELLTSLKSGGGVKVLATSESGASGAFSIPLNGFAQALEGEPFDPRKPRTPMRCDQGSWRGCALP